MITIKKLKELIADLPDDMPVAINETANEATGLADSVVVINGEDDENCPYDKGDDVYAMAGFRREKNPNYPIQSYTKICFINS